MKRKYVNFCICCSLILNFSQAVYAEEHLQSISEKKESFKRNDSDLDRKTLHQLRTVNNLLDEKRFELKLLYDQVHTLYHSNAPVAQYEALLAQIGALKQEIVEVQEMWRDETASFVQKDEYALWHQPDSTLHQLVMDYGTTEFIYFVPPEIGDIHVSLNSNLPIPRESWGECLELILNQYGIGIKQLNPYLRELYFLRNDLSHLKAIVDRPEKLDLFASKARVCYILSPQTTDPRGDLHFLLRFSNLATTNIEIIGGKIFITATVETIQELLKLYDFVKNGGGRQEFQLVTLSKLDANEMERILFAAFHNGGITEESSTLRVIPLANLSQSLFLSGNKEDLSKAIKLIRDVEEQIEDPQEKTVFWYTAKHSDAEELATVLARVYDLLIENQQKSIKTIAAAVKKPDEKKKETMVVAPHAVEPRRGERTSHKTADGQNNFIVDAKTGSIIMVVEQDALPKIKELLKKLDVPKKMVQIEVLLFEKKVSSQNKIGLNLFKLGSTAATAMTDWGLKWGTSGGSGILEFLISRGKGSGIPGYDLAYQFLLGQEDVQINATPSITTMNQTPATIAIVEEISIDAGVNEKNNRIYQRAQYGITIQITPTINMDDEEVFSEEGCGFVTLDTDITFDTTKNAGNNNDRPDVTRRHIKNHVRIADGQTVILGGLRRKNTQDSKDSIPFLGEIPGIGKLFSHTEMADNSTEMFIFITPKIIADPIEDAERLKMEELKKRPGDVPELLHEVLRAKEKQKRRLFEGSLTALFGRGNTVTTTRRDSGEYDGK